VGNWEIRENVVIVRIVAGLHLGLGLEPAWGGMEILRLQELLKPRLVRWYISNIMILVHVARYLLTDSLTGSGEEQGCEEERERRSDGARVHASRRRKGGREEGKKGGRE
jgi:hypothetical protein